MRNLDPALVAKRGLSAFTYQLVAAEPSAPRRRTPTMLDALRAWGLPVEPHWRALRRHRRRWSPSAHEWADKRRDARLRHRRRRRSRSTTWRCASALGTHQQVSALGDRVQVPGASRRRRSCRQIDVNVGRTGAVTPFAVLEPVFARRLDDLDGDAAQRRRHRAQGHPRRRLGGRREGRRRHPAGRRPGAQPAAAGRAAVGDADDVPALRQRAAPRRRRGRLALREHVVPGASCSAASSTSPRAAR